MNSSNLEYIPSEKSFIENILRLNIGKKVTIYQTFNNGETKEFCGIIENAGSDHIILSDPNTGKWYFLVALYINYIECDEKINTLEQFYSSIK